METSSLTQLVSRLSTHGGSSGDIALIAKQPVFDLRGNVWGYELLFRDPLLRGGLGDKSPHAATSTVMIDGFELMRPMLRGRQRFLINFTAEFLEAELPTLLPPDIAVIEVLETVEPTESVLAGLASLKRQGYLLALDDYIGQPELSPFLSLVDIVKVDVLACGEDKLVPLARSLARTSAALLAEKVETAKMARCCRENGFSLFQGYHYSRAELLRGKKLTPSQATKTRLLSLAAKSDADLRQMAELIKPDVSLTYKLLRYINSLYFGLPMKVRDVEHALRMLGTQRVRQWLCVTALAEMGDSPMSQELARASAYRARFLSNMGEKRSVDSRHSKDISPSLFLVGLFSFLDMLLQVPQEEAFASIPIEHNVLRALVHNDGPFVPWKGLVGAYEDGDWALSEALYSSLGLNSLDVVAAYVEAAEWSTAIFGPLDTPPAKGGNGTGNGRQRPSRQTFVVDAP